MPKDMPKGRNETGPLAGETTDTLTISPEKVCFIIVKAKEFDVKDGDRARSRVQSDG
jgi:hypothetical protein